MRRSCVVTYPFSYNTQNLRGIQAMAKDYAVLPANKVRRSDRQIDDQGWMVEFLARSPVASLATVYEGQPFINTNLFAYDADDHVVYLHTARVGRTRANVDADASVCLSVMEMGRLLPADEALEFSVEYAGVTIFGKGVIVEGAAAEHGLQLLMDKYFPHLRPERDYRPIHLDELVRTSVFRIDIDTWSGKRKSEAADFPGAFLYGQQSSVIKGTEVPSLIETLPQPQGSTQ